MQQLSLWRGLLGVDQATIIEDIEYDPTSDLVVAHVRPTKKLNPGAVSARPGVVVGKLPRARHAAGHTRFLINRSPGWPRSVPKLR